MLTNKKMKLVIKTTHIIEEINEPLNKEGR